MARRWVEPDKACTLILIFGVDGSLKKITQIPNEPLTVYSSISVYSQFYWNATWRYSGSHLCLLAEETACFLLPLAYSGVEGGGGTAPAPINLTHAGCVEGPIDFNLRQSHFLGAAVGGQRSRPNSDSPKPTLRSYLPHF